MKTLFTVLFIALALSACTPAQQQQADTAQATFDKAAPVVQADIVKATPAINTAVDIGLTVTGKDKLIPVNDAATAIIEKGQAVTAPQATIPAAVPTSP